MWRDITEICMYVRLHRVSLTFIDIEDTIHFSFLIAHLCMSHLLDCTI